MYGVDGDGLDGPVRDTGHDLSIQSSQSSLYPLEACPVLGDRGLQLGTTLAEHLP